MKPCTHMVNVARYEPAHNSTKIINRWHDARHLQVHLLAV